MPPPAPYGPLPSPRQFAWHELEVYGFVHFTVNTFTDKEWGYGDEPESVFNPTDFDADQIAQVAKEGGLKALILTAKHHDGFCLWPSKLTDHSVKRSPWKGGKGDVVRELAGACKRHGLKFGVYLSPWDRNHPEYGRPAYIDYYRGQLRELLTQYGPLFEVWFDGANGGDGYYGGARETRTVDRARYYGWEKTFSLVRELQPNAAIFSDIGPDVRWVGNENGQAGDPCWATYTPHGLEKDDEPGAGLTKYWEGVNGHRDGRYWMPAECDVSIRPGWFYHAAEDSKVKTPEQLVDLYYQSVGRGASMLLNLPPDRRGRIHDADVKSLREMRGILDATFSKDLTRKAKAIASNVRGASRAYAAKNLLDGKRTTYWSTDDGVTTPEVTLELLAPTRFSVIRLREAIALGQRVDSFGVDVWEGGAWREVVTAQAIGSCRLLRIEPVTTTRVRLRITKAPVCPAIAEFGLFLEPGR